MADAENDRNPEKSTPKGGQGAPSVLSDPHRLKSDCRMIERAIREGWPVPVEKMPTIVERLTGIVAKTSVDVPTKDGTYPSESHADSNAIAAARVLTQMTAQNQTAYLKYADKEAPDQHEVRGLNITIVEDKHPTPPQE